MMALKSAFPQSPPDPLNEYYLRFCYVCKEEATPGQPHRFNYGGIVCLSCRAFFRRANQSTKNPSFQCRRGNSCQVSVLNRRDCQKCRYNRCIAAGMNPNYVMTAYERRVRLEKSLTKKLQKMNELKSDERVSDSTSSILEQTNIENIINEADGNTSFATSNDETPSYPLSTVYSTSARCDQNEAKMSHLENVFKISLDQVKAHEEEEVARVATSSHQIERIISGEDRFNLVRHSLENFVKIVSEHFRIFAYSQSQFLNLKSELGMSILRLNTPLYIQLILGLSLSSAEDQNFDFSRHYLKQSSDLSFYVNLVENLKPFSSISLLQRSLLAQIILFNIKDPILLKEKEIQQVVSDNESLFQYSFGIDSSPESLLSILSLMSQFAAVNFNWKSNNSDSTSMCQHVAIPFTQEEMKWVSLRCGEFDEAFRSVPLGEEHLKEAMMFHLDVPLGKKFFAETLAIFRERILRVPHINPEFKSLTFTAQEEVVRNNLSLGLALFVVRMESAVDAFSQFQNAIGELDADLWRRNYMPVFNSKTGPKMKLMTIRESFSTSSVQLNQDDVDQLNDIVSNLRNLVSDPFMFKLIMLYILTKVPAGNLLHYEKLSHLHLKYQLIISRHLECKKQIESRPKKMMTPDDVFIKIALLNNLSNILEKIMKPK